MEVSVVMAMRLTVSAAPATARLAKGCSGRRWGMDAVAVMSVPSGRVLSG